MNQFLIKKNVYVIFVADLTLRLKLLNHATVLDDSRSINAEAEPEIKHACRSSLL